MMSDVNRIKAELDEARAEVERLTTERNKLRDRVMLAEGNAQYHRNEVERLRACQGPPDELLESRVGEPEKCRRCRGRGDVYRAGWFSSGDREDEELYRSRCPECMGEGSVRVWPASREMVPASALAAAQEECARWEFVARTLAVAAEKEAPNASA